jgi:hypothetical protein
VRGLIREIQRGRRIFTEFVFGFLPIGIESSEVYNQLLPYTEENQKAESSESTWKVSLSDEIIRDYIERNKLKT